MNKRLIKQIIIGCLSAVIVGLAGWGIYYWLQPAPSCFDNKLNQDEEMVDCGGSCLACDLKYGTALQVLTTGQDAPFFVRNYDDLIDIVFKLVNNNPEWGAKSFSYQIILRNADQEEQIIDGTNFILPYERKTIIVPLVQLQIANPTNMEIKILPETISWVKATIDLAALGVEGVDLFSVDNVKLLYPKLPPAQQLNMYEFSKTLKLAMEDPEVANLQKVLAATPSIYPEGKITGYFDKATEAAVMRFQEKYNIRVTGQVGPQTRAKLNELYGTGFRSFSYTFTQYLEKGMEGIEVLNLQRALNLDATDKPQGSISGYFDEATEKALKEFQKKHGLIETGIVDYPTREVLNELFKEPTLEPMLTGEYFTPEEASLKVTGTLFNSSSLYWKEGKVGVLICDPEQNNQVVAVGMAPVENIYPRSSAPFTIIFKQNLGQKVVVCDKVVSVNILDENNGALPTSGE